MTQNQFCQHERCLFHKTQSTSMDCDMDVVITKVREGDGLWKKCKHCGLVINFSGVTPEDSEAFYNTTYISENSYSKGEMLTAKAHFDTRIQSIQSIVDLISPYLNPNMRVFELGAATGEFLFLIKDKVKYCFGNEINQLYATFIKHELGIDSSFKDYFKLQFSEKFDLILAINTIDHIYDTKGTVEKIYADLTEDGYFYVEVPNDYQALKTFLPEPQRTQFQEFMYQKAHYYSFTFDTLNRLLTEAGFKIIFEKSRHDYTILNYLHWYFLGKPQKKLQSATLDTDIHEGHSLFEKEMNQLFADMNQKFKQIMAKHKVGESLCVLAQKVKKD